MKIYEINGRQYTFHTENFLRKDFLEMCEVHGRQDIREFNNICDRIFTKMLGEDVIEHMPLIDYSLAVMIMQKEVMNIIASIGSPMDLSDEKIENVEEIESEEDEIREFLKRFLN